MDLLQQYPVPFDEIYVAKEVMESKTQAKNLFTVENLKLAFSFIDLTSLKATDSEQTAKDLAEKVNKFQVLYSSMPNVAAICVFPPLVKPVATYLKVKTVGLASVGAGFPSSQTFIDIKVLECKMAASSGATDIDVVISLGTFLAGDYQTVFDEIKAIKESIGHSHLKVILETGALATVEQVWNASIIAMEAGAEFIKTSTGKIDNVATPEAIYVMCKAIEAFNKKTGKTVGIKPSGGLVTSQDALAFIAIVKMVLGDDWLTNKRFRFGASRLANSIIADVIKLELGIDEEVSYF